MTSATVSMTANVSRYCVSETESDIFGGTKKKSNATTDRNDAKTPGPRPSRMATAITPSRYSMAMLARSRNEVSSAAASDTAPHTAAAVSASDWTHAYPRELAAYPLASLKHVKYWPPVARVDNVYGDKHVFCSCVPVEAFKEEDEAAAI